MEITQTAALTAAAILTADALVHVYWLTGRTWPAPDTKTLSHAVLNADYPFTPRVLITLIAILTGGTVLLADRAGIGPAVPHWITTTGAYAVAAGAGLRALAGFVWAAGIGSQRGTIFHRLNIVAYTPLCLVLAGAALLAAH
ncbi:DUF3995 domain-containing protein [Hamadaea tsunoensis]|uniref:DUF3995 domain-containing protein n=1 Tax=Hamadaea tsunoensis TaxID=53368 RepID=UPI000425F9E8|nr:DUF3995 domain-containing protein [Hamadaea tsunoensis]